MRVGTVCYATEQGLGRLAKSFYDAGVITDVVVLQHPGGRPTQPWYPGAKVVATRHFANEVKDFVKAMDVMLFFETPFDWNVVPMCRRSVLVTMYEWYLQNPPHKFDKLICPSLLDLQYFPKGQYLPIPVDPRTWRKRTQALRFLHNAGWIGSREHKGTRELLEAVKHVKSPLHLTVRSQDVEGLKRLIRYANVPENAKLTIDLGTKPYESLFDGFDVLVAPEKYNGLSLPLQEARAAGLHVLASDRFPANDWLPRPLIPVAKYQRARAHPGHLELDEAVIEPRAIAASMDRMYGDAIDSESGLQWAKENSWENLKPQWCSALSA